MAASIDWTDDTIARLRALWDEGHSTAEIGRRMGITKNAVVGKAHRLDLAGRESPIRRGASAPSPPAPAPDGEAKPAAAAVRPDQAGCGAAGSSTCAAAAAAAASPARAVRPALLLAAGRAGQARLPVLR